MMRNTNMANKQQTLACIMFLDLKYKMEETTTQKKKENHEGTNGLSLLPSPLLALLSFLLK